MIAAFVKVLECFGKALLINLASIIIFGLAFTAYMTFKGELPSELDAFFKASGFFIAIFGSVGLPVILISAFIQTWIAINNLPVDEEGNVKV